MAVVGTDRAALVGTTAESKGRFISGSRDLGWNSGGTSRIHVVQALSRSGVGKSGHADGDSQDGLDGELHLGIWLDDLGQVSNWVFVMTPSRLALSLVDSCCDGVDCSWQICDVCPEVDACVESNWRMARRRGLNRGMDTPIHLIPPIHRHLDAVLDESKCMGTCLMNEWLRSPHKFKTRNHFTRACQPSARLTGAIPRAGALAAA